MMDLYIQLKKLDKVRGRLAESKIKLNNILSKRKRLVYQSLETDSLGESLVPKDFQYPSNLVKVIKTTGNGDCLYNAVSISLIGKLMHAKVINSTHDALEVNELAFQSVQT